MKDIQDIFYTHLEEIKKSNLPLHVKKTAEEISHCRTNAMHGHMYSCPENHFSVFLRNSCNNKLCPTCQTHHRIAWNERNKVMSLNADHYHIVFKLPSFCYPIFLSHYKELIKILFNSSKVTISTILKYSQYEFTTPGNIMVTHTYGEDNQLHPHLHVIMSSGGLSSDEKNWVNYDQSLFSLENFNTIYTAILKKQLSLFYAKHPSLGKEFHESIIKFNNPDVFVSTRYNSADTVIDYLSKTVKGSSIHNNDLLEIKNNQVKYRVKSGKTTELKEDEFIRRYLLHVLPPQLKSIRYGGLYSSSLRKKLAIARKLLPEKPLIIEEVSDEIKDVQTDEIAPYKFCPVCRKKMILTEKVLPFSVPHLIYIKFGKDPPVQELFNRIAV